MNDQRDIYLNIGKQTYNIKTRLDDETLTRVRELIREAGGTPVKGMGQDGILALTCLQLAYSLDTVMNRLKTLENALNERFGEYTPTPTQTEAAPAAENQNPSDAKDLPAQDNADSSDSSGIAGSAELKRSAGSEVLPADPQAAHAAQQQRNKPSAAASIMFDPAHSKVEPVSPIEPNVPMLGVANSSVEISLSDGEYILSDIR